MLPVVGVLLGITIIIDPEVAASVQMKDGRRQDENDGIALAVRRLAIPVRVTAVVVATIITIIMQMVGSVAVIPRRLRAVLATRQNLPGELGNVPHL
jgi:hypothetical protein